MKAHYLLRLSLIDAAAFCYTGAWFVLGILMGIVLVLFMACAHQPVPVVAKTDKVCVRQCMNIEAACIGGNITMRRVCGNAYQDCLATCD